VWFTCQKESESEILLLWQGPYYVRHGLLMARSTNTCTSTAGLPGIRRASISFDAAPHMRSNLSVGKVEDVGPS